MTVFIRLLAYFPGEYQVNIEFVISFFIYAALLTVVGWLFAKKQKTSSDFMVGGRSINYWVTAIATHATDMSAWLFMAFPGAIYTYGLPACWSAIGLLICMYLTWQFVAPKLRTATEHYGALTLSSYFEKRFNDKSGVLRTVSASIALFFFTLYISAGIVALGRALHATFGFSYLTGITIGTLAVALYTLLGGFIAVAWNDFLQGSFVFLVMLFVPAYALYHIGGLDVITQAAHTQNIALTLLPDFSLTTLSTLLIPALGWGLGYFGQPHILVNFMGLDNPDNMHKAKRVGIAWQLITMSAAVLVGLVGIAFFKIPLANNELVFIAIVKSLFSPLFAGFILCAILAAAISTMDSQILVSASMIAQDLYKSVFHRTATPERLVTLSRIGGIVITLLSFLFALNNDESIFALVRYAWCGLGSTFGPVLLFSLYSKKITRNGALTGIVVGGIVAGVWKYLHVPFTDYAIIPGFILSLISIITISEITRK